MTADPGVTERVGGARRALPPFAVRAVATVRVVPHLATYAGVGLIVAGFALLALAWGKVAGLRQVYEQLPYVASAAFPGLGLVVCGVAVVSAAARARDAARRGAQLRELATTLAELRALLGPEGQ